MSIAKACSGSLGKRIHCKKQNRQANFSSQQSMTPAFLDQTSIFVMEELNTIAIELSAACYRQENSEEIMRNFLVKLEKLRGNQK